MVSKVQPGREVLERMAVYRRLAGIGILRNTYAGKFAVAALVGVLIPLFTFIIWLLLSRSDWEQVYPMLVALALACFAGFLGTMWLLRELLVPIDLTAEALHDYISTRRLPDLPLHLPDRAGKLMEGTQYTLSQLHETIGRLERVSDTDELIGIYNRRAGEKRLGEESARAERDLQTFQIALFDIGGFTAINDRHGHSAGDACISHIAALLQLNTRRGDWVARWGADEFIVGLHRNRALKMVMERIVKAISSSPCEIAPGLELRLSVACGVADYRFGSGPAGVIADADKALFVAKELSRSDGRSHVCYRHELPDMLPVSPEKIAASAD